MPNSKTHAEKNFELAAFAGGCFWCMEPVFAIQKGVISVAVGYTGGRTKNPTYEEVSSGGTGHYEAIQITYDPKTISYEKILDIYWHNIDSTDEGGQFSDRGPQYRTAIFYHTDSQRKIAEESKLKLERSGKSDRPIVTEILKAGEFYKAEEYHQGYYKKNRVRYNIYKAGSGRDTYLKKRELTPMQYHVTQECGTEPPFQNEYWDNKRDGLYVDVVSGEVLFGSRDKYDSKTGWPSFTKLLEPDNIMEKKDTSHGMDRIEVRSKKGDSHLGHLFPDGPKPTGLRYCINSAALRFIPKEDLGKEGYAKYKRLFEE